MSSIIAFTMAQHFRLNPCDYLFWGQHRMNARRGQGGNVAFMLMDLEGELRADWLRDALAAVIKEHPVILGRFDCTLITGRPMWTVHAPARSDLDRAVDRAFRHEDLRNDPHWRETLAERSAVGNVTNWNTNADPLVRLEHYALPNYSARLIIRWPHALMDAEGAQWFLGELSRCGAGQSPRPASLADDHEIIDPIAAHGLPTRCRLFARGASYQRTHSKSRIRLMPPESTTGPIDHRVIHRNLSAEETRRVQAAARLTMPSGPLLYARHLAASIVRAVHRLYLQRGIETDAYLITLPMRVGSSDPAGKLFSRRPMNGNYLISPMLCIPRGIAADPQAIGEMITNQLTSYHERRGDLLQWTMMWAASLIHAWVYELVFALPFGGGSFATGNSFYGEIDSPVRRMGDATVSNLWGGGPNTTPPGLNPVFSRFADRLNLTLTYTRPAISDATAAEYVKLIECEMTGESLK
ncbi:MAG: hypothetical protein KF841_01250 [Phycisphaerae bacterium]|nr:hypothetical protein [Phycisphaerae bacterium]